MSNNNSNQMGLTGIEVAHLMIAIPSADVIKISVSPNISEIPSTNSWLDGVAMYGESILPVINLSKMVNEKQLTSRYEYMVIGTKDNPIAYLGANRIITRFTIEGTEIYPVNKGSDRLTNFIVGTVNLENMNWQILDINGLLMSESIKAIENE